MVNDTSEQLSDAQIKRVKEIVYQYYSRAQLKFTETIQFGHTMLCFKRLEEIYAYQLYFIGKDFERYVAPHSLISIGKDDALYITLWNDKKVIQQ